MSWPRIILDRIAMSAVFNAVVLVGFTLWPQEYSVMFPKEIKDAAAPYVNKAEARKMKQFLYGLYVLLLLFVVQLADRTSSIAKGVFHVFLFAKALLNHSPSEWFSVYNKAASTFNRS